MRDEFAPQADSMQAHLSPQQMPFGDPTHFQHQPFIGTHAHDFAHRSNNSHGMGMVQQRSLPESAVPARSVSNMTQLLAAYSSSIPCDESVADNKVCSPCMPDINSAESQQMWSQCQDTFHLQASTNTAGCASSAKAESASIYEERTMRAERGSQHLETKLSNDLASTTATMAEGAEVCRRPSARQGIRDAGAGLTATCVFRNPRVMTGVRIP